MSALTLECVNGILYKKAIKHKQNVKLFWFAAVEKVELHQCYHLSTRCIVANSY